MSASSPNIHSVRLCEGSGSPLVLSHALGLDHTMWLGIAQAMQGRRTVFAYDHRGHGRSTTAVDTPGWTLDDLVEDAAAVIRQHSEQPVVFVGLSMGGMVAQGLALRHAGLLRAAVLAHTVGSYDALARTAWQQRIKAIEQGGIEAVVDTIVSRYLHQDYRSAHPDATGSLRSQLLRNDAAAYISSCRAVASVDWVAQLPQLRLPTLVVAGRHDIGAPPAEAERIAKAVPGAKLVMLENSSHLSPLEEPQAFVSALDRFLQAIEA